MVDVLRGASGLARYIAPACFVRGARLAPFGYRAAGDSRNYCRKHRADGDAWLAEIKQQRLDRLEAL